MEFCSTAKNHSVIRDRGILHGGSFRFLALAGLLVGVIHHHVSTGICKTTAHHRTLFGSHAAESLILHEHCLCIQFRIRQIKVDRAAVEILQRCSVLVGIAKNEGHVRIPCLLSCHAAKERTLEVIGLTHRNMLGGGLGLIGARIIDDAHEVFEVKLHPLHFFRQMLEKGRIGSLLRIINVRHRLGNTLAKGTFPHAIGDGHGKARIACVGGPLRKSFSEPLCVLDLLLVGRQVLVVLAPRDELRLHRIIWLRIRIFVIVRKLDGVGVHVSDHVTVRTDEVTNAIVHPGPVHTGFGNDFLNLRKKVVLGAHHVTRALFAIVVSTHGRGGGTEERGHLVKLMLRPVREGVVVALCTGDVRAEEHRKSVGKVVQRHAGITEQVTCSTIVPHFARGRQHVIHHLIPRAVLRHLILQPIDVRNATQVLLLEAILHAEHFGQVIEHMAVVAGAVQKHVDQLRTLVRIGILDESQSFVMAWNAAHDVHIDATNKLLVIRHRIESGDRGLAALHSFWIRLHQTASDDTINRRRSLGHRGARQHHGLLGALHRLREGLIFRRQISQRKPMRGSVCGLQDDVLSIESDE